MDTHELLVRALVLLFAAVVAVPVFKRLGLGSVLGYLAAGAVLGPWGLRLVAEAEAIRHFAELGVVLLLFVIGLEILPRRLWDLRRSVFGLGGAQVLGTGAVAAAFAFVLGVDAAAATIAGLGLALSSTAFALQMLAEKHQLTAPHGRAAFAILLLQDLAVIPLLALVPLLGQGGGGDGGGWLAVLEGLGAFVAVVVGGRYLLRPIFRLVASVHSHEAFTAAALALVVGVALLMDAVGLSMAFGAFVAGVLLADSEYRHELEADIEPFKGLLLGLFFLAVGMSVNFGLVLRRPLVVVALVVGLVVIKALVLYGIGRGAGMHRSSAATLAVSLSQGGEFAFVLFGVATASGAMASDLADLLTVVVTLSMATTPLLFAFNERVLQRLLGAQTAAPDERPPDEENPVIIAGFGRFGQIVGRVLAARNIGFTALDKDPKHLEFVARFGNKVYFGDASRLDLLRTAGADKARVFVLAIDDAEASVRAAEIARQNFPHLRVLARARNRLHAYRLIDLGVDVVNRETFASSIEVAREVLVALDFPETMASETVRVFRDHDEDLLFRAVKHHGDMEKLIAIATAGRQELEDLFNRDRR